MIEVWKLPGKRAERFDSWKTLFNYSTSHREVKVQLACVMSRRLRNLRHVKRISYSKASAHKYLLIINHEGKQVPSMKICEEWRRKIFKTIMKKPTFLKLSTNGASLYSLHSQGYCIKCEHSDCDLHGNLRWWCQQAMPAVRKIEFFMWCLFWVVKIDRS